MKLETQTEQLISETVTVYGLSPQIGVHALAQTANAQELTDSQVADIKAAQEKMMESAQKLFSKMYEQTQGAQGQAGPGPDMGNMGGNAGAQGGNEAGYGDDVVDADYKEV